MPARMPPIRGQNLKRIFRPWHSSLRTEPSCDVEIVIDKSSMDREVHVRLHESLWVKVPLAIQLRGWLPN